MYDFNEPINRRKSDSVKWNQYPADVIPMWIADMDFRSPPAVIHALEERAKHGIFGYGIEEPGLREAVCSWVERRYDWKINPEQMIFVPGVVPGLNWTIQKLIKKNEKYLIQTPVYPPFFQLAENSGSKSLSAPLAKDSSGWYFQDITNTKTAIEPDTKALILCNPHNPVGRVFTKAELMQVAEICEQEDLIIISDEIHADLVYRDHKHIPIASLEKSISERCITLLAPSKTFNIAGLYCSVLICENEQILKILNTYRNGVIIEPNILAQTAARAAYLKGEDWLEAVLEYLDINRKVIQGFVASEMPQLKYHLPEGTFLAWIDCSAISTDTDPAAFFLSEAKVALSPGRIFGEEGKHFVRMNFGCTHTILQEALERMRLAYQKVV